MEYFERLTPFDWTVIGYGSALLAFAGLLLFLSLVYRQRSLMKVALAPDPAVVKPSPIHLVSTLPQNLISRIPLMFLVVAVVALATGAQFFFDSDPGPSNPNSLILLCALPLVAGLLAYRERFLPDVKALEKPIVLPDTEVSLDWSQVKAYPLRSYLITVSVALFLFSAWQARAIENNLIAGLSWLAGLALYLSAFVPGSPSLQLGDWKVWFRGQRGEVLLVLFVVAFAVITRSYNLDWPHTGLEEDAAGFAADALRLYQGEQLPLFGLAWFHGTPAIYGYLHLWSLQLFGLNNLGLNFISVVQGSLNIVLLFLLLRSWFGLGVAAVTSVLLSVSSHHLYYSRTAENNLVVPLFVTATLYFIQRGLNSKRLLDYALAGTCFGLGLWWDYNNKSVQMFPILGLILVCLGLWIPHYWRANIARLGIAVVSASLILLPVWSALASTNQLWSDWTHERFILAHLDDWAYNQYQTHDLTWIMLHQAEFTVFGLNHLYAQPFSAPYPMMDSWTAVAFFIGLAYSLWRLNDYRYGVFVIWWLFGVQPSIWSLNPPYAYRLVFALVPSYCLAGIGFWKVLSLWTHSFNWQKPVYAWVIAALVLTSICYNNLLFYFNPANYPAHWLHFDTVGRIIKDNSPDHDIYLVGAPWVFSWSGTVQWASALESLKATNAENASEIVPLSQPVDRNVLFIFVGGNYDDLETIRQMYPDGVVTHWRDEVHNLDDVLRTYEITPEQTNRLIISK